MNEIRKHVVYDFRSSNLTNLMEKAERLEWEEIKEGTDVNQMWKQLHSCIDFLIESSIPHQTVFLTAKDKCWMTPLTKLLLINRK